MSELFDIGHVAQLHEIQVARLRRGETGIGSFVEELIRRLTSGGVAGKSDDLRVVQAKRYWDLGVGRELDKKSFEDYLADIPEIPETLCADDPAYPYLVLVEPRIGLVKLCRLGNIAFAGDDQTLVPFDARHADGSQPFWTRIQDGRKNRNRRPSECRESFAKDELGLTALLGVCAYLQNPSVVTDLNKGSDGHVMDLAGSVHRESRVSCACLRVRDGRAELDWCWSDDAGPHYGSASRRECQAF